MEFLLKQRQPSSVLGASDASLLRGAYAIMSILAVYLFLAFYRIDHQSLWGDELASIQHAVPDESIFTSKIWLNGHGPLYFVLLHFWIKLGQTEFALRSLSAILGIAAVGLTYMLGLRLVGRRFAVIAATLFATSPFLIWYAQEARYISLAMTTVLLCTYWFYRVLSTESSRAWLLYAITTLLAMLAFLPNAFVILGQGIYVLWSRNGRRIQRWLIYQTGVLVVFGGWLILAYGGFFLINVPISGVDPSRLSTGTPKELSAAVIPYTFLTFSSGFSLGPSVAELHVSRDLTTLLEHVPTLAPVTLLFGGLCLFGVAKLWRQTHTAGLPLLWLIIPLLGVFLVSATTNVAYNVRYVCAALPAYIFILALGINALRMRSIQLGVLLAVLVANGASLAQYYFNPRYAKADARGAARYLESAGDTHGAIVLVGNSAAFQHYYRGNLPLVRWNQSANSNRDTVSNNVDDLANHYGRLWFVAIRPWETDPKGNVKAVLNQSFQNTHFIALPGVEIASYVAKMPTSKSDAFPITSRPEPQS